MYKHLTQADRSIIQEMLFKRQNFSAIARAIGVHRSTILREFKRNKGVHGYFAKGAQANMRSRRPCLVEYARKIEGRLENTIVHLLHEGWSPEQISMRLREEKVQTVSHESIYRFILFDQRSGGKLYQLLRRSRRGRRPYRKRINNPQTRFKKRLITERCESANKRLELGHWERDLVCDGKKKAALLTIVDRKSRFTRIRRVDSFKTSAVNRETINALKAGPCITITNDNGIEFLKPDEIERELSAQVFFTHPYSAWERGTNENTNGLLRQFFPKKTAIDEIPQWQIEKAEQMLNDRPRKTLGWKTPREIFFGIETRLID